MFFEIRAAIAIIASLIGAYTDFKTGLIYDKITYPLIVLGILFNAWEIFSIGITINNFILFFAPALIVFAIGYLFYFTGKLGGGDVKIFSGLALILPTINGEIFIVNVLLFSVLIGTTCISLYYLIQYARKGIDLKENSKSIQKALLFAILLIGYFFFLSQFGLKTLTLVVLIVPLFLALIFLALEKGIRKSFFLKWISLNEIEEDEIIAEELLEEEQRKKLNLGFKGLIQPQDAEKLKQLGIEKLPVYRNLPKFGPYIFVGVLLAIVIPNAFSLLFL